MSFLKRLFGASRFPDDRTEAILARHLDRDFKAFPMADYTPAPSSVDWMRLDVAAEVFQKESGLPAAPILRAVGDADLYCVDSEARIVLFDHEVNELKPVGLDFWELFEREVAELHARKVRRVGQSTA